MSDQPEQPTLLDQEAFADHMEGVLRSAPDITLLGNDEFGFRMRIGEIELRLGLDNLYQTYIQRPQLLSEIEATMLKALRNYNAAREVSNFDDLRTRIFPMLKPISILAHITERGLPMIVYRPFLADLIIAYVIDEPSSVAFINEQHLERWQIGDQILHDTAIRNLAERTNERGSFTTAGEGSQHIIVFNTQDGFDATRLLLPTLLSQWRNQFPGQMVIGVPNRDFLICFSDADRSILANVARQVQFDTTNREHGLTDQLFTLVNGEVREYDWE